MIEIKIDQNQLREAVSQGMDMFLKAVTDTILNAIGGQLTGENMAELNSDQVTLLAYRMLHEEVMDGGFVQLIHNQLGPFFFRNPFAKILKQWGLTDLSKLIYKAGKLYGQYHEEIERDYTDDEFMALFERFPKFDDLDDDFVENEEEWTSMIACYVDDHIDSFVKAVGAA